jgi:glutamate/tyrosine decarboxylase-like PLP-dependent enzyme
VARDGLAGAPSISVLASAQRHASIDRAVSLLGLGRDNIVPLATDELGRISPVALKEALIATASQPSILALQAGDIATGAFDRFEELIPIARAAGAWVHVDGAFGLWARASERFRHLAEGCELADSWATDGHKILNIPFDCGYAFVAHPDDHRAGLSLRASYLTHATDARDQIEWNPDWSRRARGFPTYAALRSLGRKGLAELFERLCERTSALAEGLAAVPGAELVVAPTINQALVRFTLPNGSDEENDRHTDAVMEAINRSGEAFFTGANWCERRVMRISVCNWRTSESDVERAVAAAGNAVASLSAGSDAAQG